MATTKIPDLPLLITAEDDDIFIIDDVDKVTSKITWSNLKKSLSNIQTSITISAGQMQAPGLSLGDSQCGVYSPASGTFVITTAYQNRLVVDADGAVGIGGFPVIPGAKLSVIGGPLDMGSNKITSVALCTADTDAASKVYVDSVVAAGAGSVTIDLRNLPSLP